MVVAVVVLHQLVELVDDFRFDLGEVRRKSVREWGLRRRCGVPGGNSRGETTRRGSWSVSEEELVSQKTIRGRAREKRRRRTNVKDLNRSRPEHIVLTQTERKNRLNERKELDLVSTEADGSLVDGRPTDRVPESMKDEDPISPDVTSEFPDGSSFLQTYEVSFELSKEGEVKERDEPEVRKPQSQPRPTKEERTSCRSTTSTEPNRTTTHPSLRGC